MGVSDSLTHIFLWATLVVNAALFVLLIVLSIKHIQTSVFQFLSAAAVTAGCFFALQHNAAFTLNATLFAQGILLVCHCALLLYKALKEIWTPSAFAQYRKMKNSNTKAVNNAELNADTALSLIGRDIMELSSDAIYVHSNIAYLLERLNDIVMQKTEADGSAVLLVHDFEDKVTVKTVAGEFPPPYELPENIPHKQAVVAVHFKNVEFPFENNIFGDIIKSGKGELISSPQNDSRIFQNGPEDFLQASSYIFVPMKVRDTIVGIIALVRKKNSRAFTMEHLETAKILSDFASIAVKNMYIFQEINERTELTHETAITGKVQKELYLNKIPVLPSLSVGNMFKASAGVCSDYFDIIPLRKNRISFILADVTGKSVTSLTIMIMIRAILHVIVNTSQTAATILSWANKGIASESAIDHYASAVLVNYDSIEKTIQFSAAGTIPVLYFTAKTKTWKKVSIESEPLGVEKETEYTDHNIKLEKDDLVVFYTDGLIEAVDDSGNQYSLERLKELIGSNASLDSKRITETVQNDINRFIGKTPLYDDQSLVILKVQ